MNKRPANSTASIRHGLGWAGWLGLLIGFVTGLSPHPGVAEVLPEAGPGLGAVSLKIDASTWKARGGLLYDIEGSIRKKLLAAGFTVPRNADESHGRLLSVTYREKKGPEYTFNAFGTIITVAFHFVPQSSRPPFEFGIVEASANSVSGTPPYWDAIHRLETNPYYFFLGEILAGRLLEHLNLREALLWAFRRALSAPPTPAALRDRLARPDHHMMPSQEFYRSFAFQRTIQVFIEANDARVTRLWPVLLDDGDSLVRIQALKMVQAFRVTDAQSQVEELAAHDPDPRVRSVAQTTVRVLRESPQE